MASGLVHPQLSGHVHAKGRSNTGSPGRKWWKSCASEKCLEYPYFEEEICFLKCFSFLIAIFSFGGVGHLMLWMNIYLYLLKVGNAQIFHVIHKPSEVGWGHCIRYGLPRSMWPMVASPPGMVIPRYWYVLITSFNPGEKSSRKQDVKWYLSTAYESDKQQWTCMVAPTSRTCKRYILFWVNHKEDLAHWVDWNVISLCPQQAGFQWGPAFPIWKKGSCQELSQIQLKPVSWHHSFFRSLFLHNGPACTPGAWTGNHIFHAFILELLATIRFHGINHLMNQGNGTGLLHIRPLVSISDHKSLCSLAGGSFFGWNQKKLQSSF